MNYLRRWILVKHSSPTLKQVAPGLTDLCHELVADTACSVQSHQAIGHMLVHLKDSASLCQVLFAADATLPAAQCFGYGGVEGPPSRVCMTLPLLRSLLDAVPNHR